ncbi:tRNA adenosine(34) deaminase TadA [Alcanivorax sediminis]|uniref:tRNA-specific adenosine deaminase n=1 Tax=Alcanivorax sediminis TaxID=2663008 RepID=A0A6N7LWC2_9GAMM|nr:tRNA adenosine(34) deaminase TadA [Alcanivorax sediminis]
MNDEDWMRRALTLAEQAAEAGEVPVGAVVVRDGELLGEGYNQPIVAHDPTSHAEVMALRHAARNEQNYRLPGSTLYVTLEPCTMCFGALIHARVSRLVYAASEPRAGVCVSQLQLPEVSFYNHKMIVEGGLLAEESAALLKGFFARRRGK